MFYLPQQEVWLHTLSTRESSLYLLSLAHTHTHSSTSLHSLTYRLHTRLDSRWKALKTLFDSPKNIYSQKSQMKVFSLDNRLTVKPHGPESSHRRCEEGPLAHLQTAVNKDPDLLLAALLTGQKFVLKISQRGSGADTYGVTDGSRD